MFWYFFLLSIDWLAVNRPLVSLLNSSLKLFVDEDEELLSNDMLFAVGSRIDFLLFFLLLLLWFISDLFSFSDLLLVLLFWADIEFFFSIIMPKEDWVDKDESFNELLKSTNWDFIYIWYIRK